MVWRSVSDLPIGNELRPGDVERAERFFGLARRPWETRDAETIPSLKDELRDNAIRSLNEQIEAGAAAAHAEGKDFVYQRNWTQTPDLFESFAPRSLFEPTRHTISFKAGAFEPGLAWNINDWVVIRCPPSVEGEE